MNGSFHVIFKMKNTNKNAYCFYSRDFVGNHNLPESKNSEIITFFLGEWFVEKNTSFYCREAALG